MQAEPSSIERARERRGLLFGFVGVIAFSITLPATRVAVAELDPTFVGLGRAVVAALFAAITLYVAQSPWPTRSQWQRLAVVAAGVVIGFPVLSAWAMQRVPASHGAVVIGLLPLATAAAGAWLAHERPSKRFWICSTLGSAIVVAFALRQGGGHLQLADLLLIGAVAAAAIAYAEGARLSRTIGGWQVISWALILALPFIVVPAALTMQHAAAASWSAWLGFGYVSLVSMYLGFFAWYKGLALGGIAKVGQVQLLQPFFTIAFSAIVIGEAVDAITFAAAALVVASIALGRRA
ncbi:MAG TPA: DMT family transporter [Casimicrobiaceae bacterium]|nr:DMT family transporter [Casimicrobiaceae bacterium]